MLAGYRNAKTSVKLLTGFALMALIVCGVGGLGLSKANKLNGYVQTLYDDRLVPAIDLGGIGVQMYGIARTALRITLEPDAGKRKGFFDAATSSSNEVERLTEKYAATSHTADEKKVLDEFRTAWKDYKEATFHTYSLALEGRVEEAKNNAFVVVPPKFTVVDNKLKRLIAIQDQVSKEIYVESGKAKDTSTKVIVVAVLVSMLVAIVAGLFISSLIAVPLKKMAAVAKKISAGDLDVVIEAKTSDEVGALEGSLEEMITYLKQMAKTAKEIADGDLRGDVTPKSNKDVLGNAFKQMLKGLRGIITDVRSGAEQMVSASAQMASTSEQAMKSNEAAATGVEETTSTMHEMSANIQNVAKNSQSQAASVTETSASVEQMVTSIQRIADNAKLFVQLSNQSKEAVENSLKTMEKSDRGTVQITQTVTKSADMIAALGSRVEDIGKILDVIDEIAEQTNLLALNAAIEAARAGEQGMGFAVVAEEVRKLAERSGRSTKEIAELISGIQAKTREAIEQMEKSILIVSDAAEFNQEVGRSLKDIENNVTEVDRYAKEISAATQEQSGGSTQIAKAAESLREVTHEISSATEEQASAAEQIVKTMEIMRETIHQNASGSTQLASSAEQLRSQADQFKELVGKFLIDDEDLAERSFKKVAPGLHAGGTGAGKHTSQRMLPTAA